MSVEAILENVIISFPTLFEPRPVGGKGDPKFSAAFIIPPEFDWATFQALCEQALNDFFGANAGR